MKLEVVVMCRYYTDMVYCCGLRPTLLVLRRLPKTRLGCHKYTVCVVALRRSVYMESRRLQGARADRLTDFGH